MLCKKRKLKIVYPFVRISFNMLRD